MNKAQVKAWMDEMTKNNIREAGSPIAGTNWRASVQIVTPEMAEGWLENNEGNRKLRRSALARYVNTMKAGAWMLTPEPIIFTKSGRLINGQHRLNAIVQSGIAVPIMVVHGVDDAVYTALDRGATRTVMDATGLHRFEVEAARHFLLIAGARSGEVSDHDITAVLGAGLSDAHQELVRASNARVRVFTSSAVRVGCIACIAAADLASDLPARQYALETYRVLAGNQVQNMSRCAAAFASQVFKGQVSTSTSGARIDLTARAFTVFDLSHRNDTRIQVKDPAPRIKKVVNVLAERYPGLKAYT